MCFKTLAIYTCLFHFHFFLSKFPLSENIIDLTGKNSDFKNLSLPCWMACRIHWYPLRTIVHSSTAELNFIRNSASVNVDFDGKRSHLTNALYPSSFPNWCGIVPSVSRRLRAVYRIYDVVKFSSHIIRDMVVLTSFPIS